MDAPGDFYKPFTLLADNQVVDYVAPLLIFSFFKNFLSSTLLVRFSVSKLLTITTVRPPRLSYEVCPVSLCRHGPASDVARLGNNQKYWRY